VIGPFAQGIQAGDLAAILKMIRRGFGYANMHTALHPGGEIRGQIKVRGSDDDLSGGFRQVLCSVETPDGKRPPGRRRSR
jgi:hypothetical protein